jgi:hypothetical protein
MSAGSCKFPIRGMPPPIPWTVLTERKLRGRRGYAIHSFLTRLWISVATGSTAYGVDLWGARMWVSNWVGRGEIVALVNQLTAID